MGDLLIDFAPVRRWRQAAAALKLKHLPEPAELRQEIEESGNDPTRAVVGYLETLLSIVLDAEIGLLPAETLGRALLAEELLLILTGTDDLPRVREWLAAPE